MNDEILVLLAPMYMEDRHCGYCKGSKQDHWALESWLKKNKRATSVTIGMSAEQMTCQQYDILMNKGFRRSGTFLYKPDLLRNCCRLYTIRTTLDQMKVAKQHRQVLNRFVRAISEETDEKSKGNGKTNKKFSMKSIIEAEKSSSRFHTHFEPAAFTNEKYQLYKKYQVAVHNDKESDVTPASFKRFLCDTPFPQREVDGTKQHFETLNTWVKQWPQRPTMTNRRVGPTHECYYLDEKLIAISVMDFLPSGVSSVYFIWDPDYAHLSLGTLSGLRELQMCQELALGYYYLGYYIDDCQKMKYKGQFGGEILDVCSGIYYPLDKVKKYIRNGRFFAINQEKSNLAELVNMSEQVFGDNAQTYSDSKQALKQLSERYSVGEPTRKSLALPDVVPGVHSFLEILEWYDQGAISGNFPFIIFLAMTGVRSRKEAEMTESERRIFVDTIRLIGMELAVNAIVFFTFP